MPPDRQAPGAKTVLADLVGKTIPTLTGIPNHVIRLDGDHVIVGTSRSPDGRPVRVSELQSAIDRLFATGELAITVDSVGYRSAFIGAVLRQLPETAYTTNPRHVWLSANRG